MLRSSYFLDILNFSTNFQYGPNGMMANVAQHAETELFSACAVAVPEIMPIVWEIHVISFHVLALNVFD